MKLLVLTFVLLLCRPAGGQERYDVIIHELMADPSPAVGLPSSEWIEVMNRSKETVNLQGWRIADRSGQSGTFPAYSLAPNAVVIICPGNAVNAMIGFGPAIAVSSFPSLDNEGDLLVLLDDRGSTMHALSYGPDWYDNDLKKEGGWSLEMIDPQNPCAGKNNWSSATDAAGGTPGGPNSVSGSRPDLDPPNLLRAYTLNDTLVRLVFDETVDSLKASLLTAYNSSDVRSGEAFPIPPLFTEVGLRLLTPMQRGLTYSIVVSTGCDCAGNVSAESRVNAGIPARMDKGKLVINEILFNPVPSGYDYVEVFNAGDSLLDLADGYLANRNSAGDITGHSALSPSPRLIFPGEYYVVTTDPNQLLLHFFSPAPGQIGVLSSMPSFPDDKGVVIVTGIQGEIIDEVAYSEKWHFPLIRNKEAVALERIDPAGLSADAANWHSASSTSGYGTPAYRNSQSVQEAGDENLVSIRPSVFSPDGDGMDDQCFIHFNLPSAGFVAQVTIYNLQGLAVRKLTQGILPGATGYRTWDGLNDKGQANPPGPYIILTTLFNLEGQVRKSKLVVVLASE